MIRPFGLLIIIATLLGCQGSESTIPTNPFGRTRVEPPRTGCTDPPGTAGLDSNAAPMTLGQTSPTKLKSAPLPGRIDPQSKGPSSEFAPLTLPVQALGQQGDCVRIPVSAQMKGSNTPLGSDLLDKSTTDVDRLHTPPNRVATPWLISTVDQSRQVLNNRKSTFSSNNPKSTYDSEIRLVSATEPISPRKSATVSARQRYDYHPHYEWLRGRLEYSQIDLKWKLRYLPIDGEVDDFGGSVVLLENPALLDFKRGDFVEVHGKLGSIDQHDDIYAPDYQVQQIKKQGR